MIRYTYAINGPAIYRFNKKRNISELSWNQPDNWTKAFIPTYKSDFKKNQIVTKEQAKKQFPLATI